MFRSQFWNHLTLMISLASCGQEVTDEDIQNRSFQPEPSPFYATDAKQNQITIDSFAITAIKASTNEYEAEAITQEITAYTNHTLNIEFTIQAAGNPFAMSLLWGLMEKPASNATAKELSALKTCTLGMIPIQHGGSSSNQAGSQTYRHEFVINPHCLPQNKTTTFTLFVTNDSKNQVQLNSKQTLSGTTVVFNQLEEGEALNKQCIGANSLPGCIYHITVTPTPGLDLIFASLKPESSIGLIRPRLQGDENPYVKDGGNEYDTPFLKVDSAIKLLGSDPALTDALDADKEVLIRYDICPAHSDDKSIATCGVSQWQTLSIYDANNANNPVSHLASVSLQEMRSNEEVHLSHNLYLESDLYNLITQGLWRNNFYFVVRGCVAGNFTLTEVFENQLPKGETRRCKTTTIKAVNLPSESENDGSRDFSLNKLWNSIFGDPKTVQITGNVEFNTFVDRENGSTMELEGQVLSAGWINLVLFGVTLSSKSYATSNPNAGTYLTFSLLGLPVFYAQVGSSNQGEPPANDGSQTSPQNNVGSDGILSALKNFFKEFCSPPLEIPPVPIGLVFCIKNTAGFNIDFGGFSKEVAVGSVREFPAAAKIGGLMGQFSPFIATIGSIELGKSWPGIFKVGLEGNADVIRFELPITTALGWGKDQTNNQLSFRLDFDTTLAISTLNGSFGVNIPLPISTIGTGTGFLGLPIPYPKFEWHSQFIPIVKWKGFSHDVNLLKRNIGSMTLR